MYYLKDYVSIITKEFLIDHFNLTNAEIAQMFNVPTRLIVRLISMHKIRRSNEQIQALAKRKLTEKYGVSNLFSLKDIQEKSKLTRLNKYGYEYTFQDTNKIKQSIMHKYNVDNVQKIKSVHEKTIATQIERYGDKIFSSDYFKLKSFQTKLDR